MDLIKGISFKIVIAALILAALLLAVVWGAERKDASSAAPVAVLADTATPVSLPSSPAPEEPEEELPTIKRSQVPDYPLLLGRSTDRVLVQDSSIEVPISLSYSQEIGLVHFKSDAELEKIITDSKIGGAGFEVESDAWRDRIKDTISRFGQIARQYLPDDAITDYYEVDLDGDGTKEKLITLCGIGGNHCSDYAQVIKNNKVVFSAKLDGGGAGSGDGITPAKEGGFYIEWTEDGSFHDEKGEWVGLCCSVSHNKTLFQFKDGKIVPIKQWKILHIWKRVIEDYEELSSECTQAALIQRKYLEKEKLSEKYTFEKYPVNTVSAKNPADLDIESSRSARVFRGAVRGGLEEGVNFAGRYSIVYVGMTGWGRNYWIVDRVNGKAYEFPYLGYEMDFRRDSNLIILDSKSIIKEAINDQGVCGSIGAQDIRTTDMKPFYFLWEGDALKLLGPTDINPVKNPFWKEYFSAGFQRISSLA